MKKLAKICGFEWNDNIMSPEHIHVFQTKRNIQGYTKTPARCSFCKEVIEPRESYMSIGAVTIETKSRIAKKKVKWKKTCGSCDTCEDFVSTWNEMVAKQRNENET